MSDGTSLLSRPNRAFVRPTAVRLTSMFLAVTQIGVFTSCRGGDISTELAVNCDQVYDTVIDTCGPLNREWVRPNPSGSGTVMRTAGQIGLEVTAQCNQMVDYPEVQGCRSQLRAVLDCTSVLIERSGEAFCAGSTVARTCESEDESLFHCILTSGRMRLDEPYDYRPTVGGRERPVDVVTDYDFDSSGTYSATRTLSSTSDDNDCGATLAWNGTWSLEDGYIGIRGATTNQEPTGCPTDHPDALIAGEVAVESFSSQMAVHWYSMEFPFYRPRSE